MDALEVWIGDTTCAGYVSRQINIARLSGSGVETMPDEYGHLYESEEKALATTEPDLPAVQEKDEEMGIGIKESDLDIRAETEQMCLKCKKCGVELHMTLAEYRARQKKEGILRCPICPDRPELFFYKCNPHRVMMAGFNQQRKKMLISKDGMKRRLGLVKESGILQKGKEHREELQGK